MIRTLVSAALAACLGAGGALAAQPAGSPPVRLLVSLIEVDDRFVPPMQPPHVEHIQRPSPSAALRAWAADHLKPVGAIDEARFVILDASATIEEIEVEKGLSGWLTDDQNRRISVRLRARLEYRGDKGEYSAEATTAVSTTLPESASFDDVDAAYSEVLSRAITSLDAKLLAEIRARFAPLLLP